MSQTTDVELNLSTIDSNRIEGRLLLAAVAMITTEIRGDKTPDAVLAELMALQKEMFPVALPEIQERPMFHVALTDLVNKYSRESESNTPDFVLANFIRKSLEAFDDSVNRRKLWYGRTTGKHEIQN